MTDVCSSKDLYPHYDDMLYELETEFTTRPKSCHRVKSYIGGAVENSEYTKSFDHFRNAVALRQHFVNVFGKTLKLRYDNGIHFIKHDFLL